SAEARDDHGLRAAQPEHPQQSPGTTVAQRRRLDLALALVAPAGTPPFGAAQSRDGKTLADGRTAGSSQRNRSAGTLYRSLQEPDGARESGSCDHPETAPALPVWTGH